jgi:hypothetical protein
MAKPRTELQTVLETLTENVYFQPPTNVVMSYPCIVYQVDDAWSEFADGLPYRYTKRYQVTVIDRDPDSPIPDQVATLPMCVLNRFFIVDNLNHTVFNLYF